MAVFIFSRFRNVKSEIFILNKTHIPCSCTRQYEWDDFLGSLWGPGDGCLSDHGRIQVVPGQIYASISFRGLVFIREYSEKLYTAKISTYTVLELQEQIHYIVFLLSLERHTAYAIYGCLQSDRSRVLGNLETRDKNLRTQRALI